MKQNKLLIIINSNSFKDKLLPILKIPTVKSTIGLIMISITMIISYIIYLKISQNKEEKKYEKE